MEKVKKIVSVRNAHGVKVKRCCASCQNKDVDPEGNRICKLMQLKVEQKFRCKDWQMSDGMRNAGLPNGGVVRLKEIVII